MKFLKGLRYTILSISVKEITFLNENLIYVIRNVTFTFDLKKLLGNALRFVIDVVVNMLSRFHSRGRPTMLEV